MLAVWMDFRIDGQYRIYGYGLLFMVDIYIYMLNLKKEAVDVLSHPFSHLFCRSQSDDVEVPHEVAHPLPHEKGPLWGASTYIHIHIYISICIYIYIILM